MMPAGDIDAFSIGNYQPPIGACVSDASGVPTTKREALTYYGPSGVSSSQIKAK
jgi:hypothetical protein